MSIKENNTEKQLFERLWDPADQLLALMVRPAIQDLPML